MQPVRLLLAQDPDRGKTSAVVQILRLDMAQLDCEPVDVHAGLEVLPRIGPCEVKVITVALSQCRGVPRAALSVKENRARL